MEKHTDTPLTLHEITYANMEYFFLARGLLLWKVDSRYVTGEEYEERRQYFSVKGIIELDSIDGLSLEFDTQTERFEVAVHLNGNYIKFTTSKEDEAEALYDLIMINRYGVRLKNFQSEQIEELLKGIAKD